MARRFSSRSAFLYEHFIANLSERDGAAGLSGSGIDSLRRGLLIIGQESRFDLFILVLRAPGVLTLDELAAKLRLNRDKVQYHLYYMLSHGVILAGLEDGKTVFRPNPVFLKSMNSLFSEA